jgi:hypothetical protein
VDGWNRPSQAKWRTKKMSNHKAEREARRAKMRELASQVSKMTDAQRQQLAARFSGVTIEGRSLSFHNQCMLAMQLPSATIVGGFRQWIKAGRCVKKGQRGSYIWIPLGPKDDNGNIDMSDEKRFMLAPVFDISQTAELNGKVAAAHKMASEVRRTVDTNNGQSSEHSDGEFEPLAA